MSSPNPKRRKVSSRSGRRPQKSKEPMPTIEEKPFDEVSNSTIGSESYGELEIIDFSSDYEYSPLSRRGFFPDPEAGFALKNMETGDLQSKLTQSKERVRMLKTSMRVLEKKVRDSE
jgi:antitoxin component YwqK of YwqJK toxin-antitoxin module